MAVLTPALSRRERERTLRPGPRRVLSADRLAGNFELFMTSPGLDDHSPFELLLQKYGDLLRDAIARLCPRRLGLQFDDIEQEARIRLWKALTSETEIGSPASYIYRIALTTTIDAVRRATARREEQLQLARDVPDRAEAGAPRALDPPTQPGQSPESLAARRILLRKIESALSRLSGDRRRAVGLHLRGFTPPEIADLLSWSEPKTRSLVYRGLRDLRTRLAAEGIEYEAG